MSDHKSDIEKIMDKLSSEDREIMESYFEQSLENSRRAAAAGIISRNFSHNIGEFSVVSSPNIFSDQ